MQNPLYHCPECTNLLHSAYCPHCKKLIPGIQDITREAKIVNDEIPLALFLQGDNPLKFNPLPKKIAEKNNEFVRMLSGNKLSM